MAVLRIVGPVCIVVVQPIRADGVRGKGVAVVHLAHELDVRGNHLDHHRSRCGGQSQVVCGNRRERQVPQGSDHGFDAVWTVGDGSQDCRAIVEIHANHPAVGIRGFCIQGDRRRSGVSAFTAGHAQGCRGRHVGGVYLRHRIFVEQISGRLFSFSRSQNTVVNQHFRQIQAGAAIVAAFDLAAHVNVVCLVDLKRGHGCLERPVGFALQIPGG